MDKIKDKIATRITVDYEDGTSRIVDIAKDANRASFLYAIREVSADNSECRVTMQDLTIKDTINLFTDVASLLIDETGCAAFINIVLPDLIDSMCDTHEAFKETFKQHVNKKAREAEAEIKNY